VHLNQLGRERERAWRQQGQKMVNGERKRVGRGSVWGVCVGRRVSGEESERAGRCRERDREWGEEREHRGGGEGGKRERRLGGAKEVNRREQRERE
jgi:hypothetical protein